MTDGPPPDLPARILAVGDPGTGKTGALAALALAGYNLKIIDLDNKLRILFNILRAQGKRGEEAIARIEYKYFANKYGITGTDLLPVGKVDAWQRCIRQIGAWSNCGLDTVLCIDSLKQMGKLSMENTQNVNCTLGVPATQREWGVAIDRLKDFIRMCVSPDMGPHLYITTHMTFIEDEFGKTRPYPVCLGSKMPGEVAGDFQAFIGFTLSKDGKRQITCIPNAGLAFQSPSLKVKETYPLETGLADYFRDLGYAPPALAKAA